MMNFRTFEISRFTDYNESGVVNQRLVDQNTSITGYLENATPEFAALIDGEFGKTFRLFSDDLECDIRIGDRCTEGSTVYDVKGVTLTTDGPGRKREIVLILPITQ